MDDYTYMSKERILCREVRSDPEIDRNIDTLLLFKIALGLAQIVDRLDELSDALDSFRPKNVEPEEEDDGEECMHVLEHDKQCETCRHRVWHGKSAESWRNCNDCKHGAWRGLNDRYENGGEDG